MAYYNCNTTITKQLNVSYVTSVPTADGNINGSIRFGGMQYMECATAMHETAHAVGIGTASNWGTYSVGGVFIGATAIAQLHAIAGHETDTLHSDTQHFWPFGLNQASEAQSPAGFGRPLPDGHRDPQGPRPAVESFVEIVGPIPEGGRGCRARKVTPTTAPASRLRRPSEEAAPRPAFRSS